MHPHRFAAPEYRFGQAGVGHVHFWGDVDIPFPRPFHDFLLEHNLALQHRWVPDSGWTTFRVGRDEDVKHAIWLMRLSYLRYAPRSAANRARDRRYVCGFATISSQLSFRRVKLWCISHSLRRACMGLTDAARHAGT